MRIELLEPEAGFTPRAVQSALGLVMEQPPELPTVASWTRIERAVAYDWAMREHLAAAGAGYQRRERPSFVLRGR